MRGRCTLSLGLGRCEYLRGHGRRGGWKEKDPVWEGRPAPPRETQGAQDTGRAGEGAQGVSPAGRGWELPAEGLLAASITEVSLPNTLSSPNLLNLILDHTQKLDERWEG